MINKLSLNYRMLSTKDNYYMWYDDDELVAMFRLVDLESDKWICNVFISPKYRKKVCHTICFTSQQLLAEKNYQSIKKIK